MLLYHGELNDGTKCHLPTAAAVLAVGRFVQSPMPKTFGYFVCCRVSLFTSKKPVLSRIDEACFNVSGTEQAGATWSIEY